MKTIKFFTIMRERNTMQINHVAKINEQLQYHNVSAKDVISIVHEYPNVIVYYAGK